MTFNWLAAFSQLSPEASRLVQKHTPGNPKDYQFKWNVLSSVLNRAVVGELRHLPSKESVAVSIKLPV